MVEGEKERGTWAGSRLVAKLSVYYTGTPMGFEMRPRK